ncbi:pentapeptide repeat-containing protein, partial [Paenibacillus sp. MMS18-CY102]|uniref:pentapeptide repeat-containing protein n=1 Tax=Paenibacillus sp. MMS18-CY102 TaxID=2682849 RepID=UPI0013664608
RMHHLEIWHQFIETDAIPLRNEHIKALHQYYTRQKKQIADELTTLVDQFLLHVLDQQQRGELKDCTMIQFSFMRTSLIEGKPIFMLEAVDRETMEKVQLTDFEYDAGWIYEYVNAWEAACEERRKRYMNRIDRHTFEVWKTEQLYPFNIYMVHAVRYAMDTISQLSSFQELAKDSYFEVRVGEYRDQEASESAYRINDRQRTSITCKGWLESRFDQEYIYEHLAKVDLANGQFEGIDLNYARLEEVTLTGSSLGGSKLLGTRFENCVCDGTDFHACLLIDADFRSCELVGARFDGAWAVRDMAVEEHGLVFGMNGVQFQRANLKGASFRHAKIAGDFTEAELDGVDFTGADLSGSRMLEKDLFRVVLTEEQRRTVTWVTAGDGAHG